MANTAVASLSPLFIFHDSHPYNSTGTTSFLIILEDCHRVLNSQVIFILFCQIKALAPSMQRWQYLLLIRTFPWVLRCSLRRQHVIQTQLFPLLMDMPVYRPFHMGPWFPLNTTWLLTAQPQKHTGLLVTRSIQRYHRFQRARQMAWLTNQIIASVIRVMDSK